MKLLFSPGEWIHQFESHFFLLILAKFWNDTLRECQRSAKALQNIDHRDAPNFYQFTSKSEGIPKRTLRLLKSLFGRILVRGQAILKVT